MLSRLASFAHSLSLPKFVHTIRGMLSRNTRFELHCPEERFPTINVVLDTRIAEAVRQSIIAARTSFRSGAEMRSLAHVVERGASANLVIREIAPSIPESAYLLSIK